MLFTKTIVSCAVALASVASAAPTVESRAVANVATDLETASVTLALSSADITADLTSTKRQVTFSADSIVTSIIDKVYNIVQGMVDSDVNRRKYYTQQVVGSAEIQFPGKNIVMANVGYSFTGNTITTQKAVYNAKLGADVTFDVLVFEAGHTFTLKGDGGFQNWCYSIQSSCKVSGGGAILQC